MFNTSKISELDTLTSINSNNLLLMQDADSKTGKVSLSDLGFIYNESSSPSFGIQHKNLNQDDYFSISNSDKIKQFQYYYETGKIRVKMDDDPSYSINLVEGESLNLDGYDFFGILTDEGKSLRITIPTIPLCAKNIDLKNFSSISGTFRHSSGGYLYCWNGSNSERMATNTPTGQFFYLYQNKELNASIDTFSIQRKYVSGLRFNINFKQALTTNNTTPKNYINNIPVGGSLNLVFTL